MQATCGEKEETDSSCECVATARGSLLVSLLLLCK